MRRLKKADFEVDFFFMNEVELFPSPVEPEKVIAILDENLNPCQHFFGRENGDSRVDASPRRNVS